MRGSCSRGASRDGACLVGREVPDAVDLVEDLHDVSELVQRGVRHVDRRGQACSLGSWMSSLSRITAPRNFRSLYSLLVSYARNTACVGEAAGQKRNQNNIMGIWYLYSREEPRARGD